MDLLAVGGVRTGTASAITLYDVVSEKPQGTIELPCHVQALAGTAPDTPTPSYFE